MFYNKYFSNRFLALVTATAEKYVADTIIASLLLNYSGKSYKLNLDNTLENKKVISLLNEINENEKTIISLLQKIIEDDKH